jgi:hypothetical protein
MKRTCLFLIAAAVMLGTVAVSSAGAAAGGNTNSGGLKVAATEFDPQHNCDANAAWIKNIGLQFAPAGQTDPFAYGFLMHKLCSTDTNAAAFGVISGAKGQFLNTPGALGFDYKKQNGGFLAHCGAGAPRFNVSMTDGFHFIGGCNNGTKTDPSPRGTGWVQVRFDPQDPNQAFPTVAPSATISSISLVFDEGSDQGAGGSPEIVLDNIVLNGTMAVKP